MKKTSIAFLLFILSFQLFSQDVEGFERALYNSYIEDRIADWDGIIRKMTAAYDKNKDPELLHSICFAQYGFIGYCIGEEMDEKAKSSLQQAMKNAKELEHIYEGRHDVLALRGALLGFKIMLSKFSSLYLGPKALKLITTASESSHIYFNCSLEKGNMSYFTPKFLGGSKEEAISYYENAVMILEKSPIKEDRNWIYINTIILLAKAYEDTGSLDKACVLYSDLLKYEPEAKRVRKEMQKKCRE